MWIGCAGMQDVRPEVGQRKAESALRPKIERCQSARGGQPKDEIPSSAAGDACMHTDTDTLILLANLRKRTDSRDA